MQIGVALTVLGVIVAIPVCPGAPVAAPPLRMALCQMVVTDGDVAGNLAKMEGLVQEAAAQGARICVFPELADVGFGPIVRAPAGAEHARPIPGETTDALGRMAVKYKVWIAVALLEKVPGGVFDANVLIDDGGRVVLRQRKAFVYPWFGGAKAFQGNYHDAQLADSPWGPIGVMNCADLAADAKRAVVARLRPAMILASFANPPAELLDQCPVLAREGNCAVVGVNQVFPQEARNKGGQSRLCRPDGSAVWRTGATETMKVVDLQIPVSLNRPPSVDAGEVQTIRLPRSTIALRGYASDDGKLASALKTNWAQVSGPAAALIDNAASLSATMTVSRAGIYLLSLTANDGDFAASSFTWVNVLPADGSELGLMGCWDLDGDVKDSSANANHGTLVGKAAYSTEVPPGTPAGRRSLDLDGKGSYVRVEHHPSLNAADAVTLCCWIKPRSYPGFVPKGNNWSSIIHKGDKWGEQNYHLGFGAYFYLHSDSMGMRIPSLDDSVRTPGRWYHVAAAIDAKRNCGKIYIDGVLDHTVFNVATAFANFAPLYIGSSKANATSIDGIIHGVRLYSRILSDVEIAAMVPGAQVNLPPVVRAGPSPAIMASGSLKLSGSFRDVGPVAASQAAGWTAWRKISGPGHVSFANRFALDTEVTFSEVGTYRLELQGSDGAHLVRDLVEVRYVPPR